LVEKLKNENNELNEKYSSLEIINRDIQEELDGVKNQYESTKKQLYEIQNSSTQVCFFPFFLQ